MSKELKLTNQEARMMRWIDGEMDADEKAAFEAEMARHDSEGDVVGHMPPGEMPVDSDRVRAEKDSADRIRSVLQSGMSIERDLPDGDGFNKGISDRISGKE
jgi:hypothetical protein